MDQTEAKIKFAVEYSVPSLFVEQVVLRAGENDPNSYHWLEKARWVKFEENFEEISKRFNDAHVSPLQFKDIVEFRTLIDEHLVIVDCNESVTTVAEAMQELVNILHKNGALVDQKDCDSMFELFMAERLHPDVKTQSKLSVQGPKSRINEGFSQDQKNEGFFFEKVYGQRRFRFQPFRQQNTDSELFNVHLTETFQKYAESCCVLSGQTNGLTRPIMKLLRLVTPLLEPGLIEVHIPVRFMFFCLGPTDRDLDYNEMGRCFAVMMKNRKFRESAYSAENGTELMQASNTFLEQSILLPLYKNINPYNLSGMANQIRKFHSEVVDLGTASWKEPTTSTKMQVQEKEEESPRYSIDTTQILAPEMAKGKPDYKKRFVEDFCPPLVTFMRAVKPYVKRWPSDFKDAFNSDNAALTFTSILFVYFVCLAPAITFGALLNAQGTGTSVVLVIFSSGIYTFLFSLLSGQPQGIIGVTAPTFIIETSIVSVSKSFGLSNATVRAWVSVYTAIFGIIGLVCNVSALTKHIRRSVEQVFNLFIAFFFILKALFTMFKSIPLSQSDARLPEVAKPNASLQVYQPGFVISQKNAIAGTTLFLAFLMLHFCLTLATLKRGTYFRRAIRKILGAFNVPLGIILILALDQIFFQQFHLPTLAIPPSDKINVSEWVNPVTADMMYNYGTADPGTVHGISFVIGFAVFLIVFTEGSFNGITALKNKAIKPGIFEADFLLLLVTFPLISGFVGWPFVSGATYIPIASLYGMFLYMGVMGMRDLTITHRILALMKRRKHWDDWEYIRGVPTPQILVFASIQMVFVTILVILNIISEFVSTAAAASLVFPIVVLIYALIREFVLPRWAWIRPYLHELDKKHKISPVSETNLPIGNKLSININEQKNRHIPLPGILNSLPADPISSFGELFNVNELWRVNSNTPEQFTVNSCDGLRYRQLLTHLSENQKKHEIDSEVERLPETWAT
ncbi:hypothetical protein Ciccas_005072 [Cichlidogyrus casuarinus]|uniref:Anion exchange protein n=1 Tax=Cichlidogyrus casuarinus TaxID=1844966 RepID=A0ABD2Q9Q2_9PLAT